ncbi:SDR family oxidoreductase [Devosia sp. A449]
MTDYLSPVKGLAGLAGQRVIVTAGAGGIGLAIVQELAAHGCRIAICDVSQAALANVQAEFPEVFAMQADVSDEVAVSDFFGAAATALGGLDALVNNAGISGPTGGIEDIDPQEWRRTIDICLTGQFLCARAAVPLLKAAGGGAIVNMSSSAGRHGYAFRTPYSSAKFGVVGLTLSLAKELGPSEIRVNALLPGIVAGPRMEKVISDRAGQVGVPVEEMRERYMQNISMRRMVDPEDVATTTAFLLSRAGRNISGQLIGVDGNVETL